MRLHAIQEQNIGAVTGLVAIALTIFLSYRFAERIIAVLGPRGTSVMIRLSAFILLCIGIQIMCNGVVSVMRTLRPNA
jgi:multiple antibiotic resistance protein